MITDGTSGIARILKQEGIEWISTFPVCRVNNGRSGLRNLDIRLGEIYMGFMPRSSTAFVRSTPHRVYTG